MLLMWLKTCIFQSTYSMASETGKRGQTRGGDKSRLPGWKDVGFQKSRTCQVSDKSTIHCLLSQVCPANIGLTRCFICLVSVSKVPGTHGTYCDKSVLTHGHGPGQRPPSVFFINDSSADKDISCLAWTMSSSFSMTTWKQFLSSKSPKDNHFKNDVKIKAEHL